MKAVPELSHQQAAEVLPWFANGTLTGEEHTAVEAHVRSCLRCRSELEQLDRWQGGLSQMMHEQPVPPAVAESRAAALIARAAASQRPVSEAGSAPESGSSSEAGFRSAPVGPGSRRSGVVAARMAALLPWLTAGPRAAMLATSMLLLAVVLTWSLLPRTPDTADFRTLTTPDSLPAGQYLRVVLQPQADAGSLDRLSRELGLSIAAGPSEHGVYTMTVDNDSWPQAVAVLQADPAVLFAETFAVPIGHESGP